MVSLCGWLLLDLRWTVNLARQVALTVTKFGGKSERDKRLADVDGVLYEFIEQVRAALPPAPQRVWVASDTPYFNGRAAYHLYPHNVHFRARDRAMPERGGQARRLAARLQSPRRRVRCWQRQLRWDGGADVPAELKVTGNAAALFLLK